MGGGGPGVARCAGRRRVPRRRGRRGRRGSAARTRPRSGRPDVAVPGDDELGVGRLRARALAGSPRPGRPPTGPATGSRRRRACRPPEDAGVGQEEGGVRRGACPAWTRTWTSGPASRARRPSAGERGRGCGDGCRGLPVPGELGVGVALRRERLAVGGRDVGGPAGEVRERGTVEHVVPVRVRRPDGHGRPPARTDGRGETVHLSGGHGRVDDQARPSRPTTTVEVVV